MRIWLGTNLSLESIALDAKYSRNLPFLIMLTWLSSKNLVRRQECKASLCRYMSRAPSAFAGGRPSSTAAQKVPSERQVKAARTEASILSCSIWPTLALFFCTRSCAMRTAYDFQRACSSGTAQEFHTAISTLWASSIVTSKMAVILSFSKGDRCLLFLPVHIFWLLSLACFAVLATIHVCLLGADNGSGNGWIRRAPEAIPRNVQVLCFYFVLFNL